MAWTFLPEQPIYTQLVSKLQADILAGIYPAGSKFPSVRDLSATACVNPNTMQRAFTELEQLGFIQSHRTNGRTITEDTTHLAMVKENLAKEHATNFIFTLTNLGYNSEQIQEILNLTLQRRQEE